jgi:uncharacterized SAM-binding protein YcdF (DUF218 family)
MTDLLKELLLPSHISTIAIIAGAVLALWSRGRNFGVRLLTIGALFYCFMSNGVVATFLISPLEYKYPAVLELQSTSPVDTAVVLAAYAVHDRNMPLSSRASAAAIYRVVEAAQITRQAGLRRVIVSGTRESAEVMVEMLIGLGVAESIVEIDDMSQHTSESASRLDKSLVDREFYLVTSAGHMPRAMATFRAKGMRPIAMPTDFKLPREARRASLMPSPLHLEASDMAIHEYLALAWYRLNGTTETLW